MMEFLWASRVSGLMSVAERAGLAYLAELKKMHLVSGLHTPSFLAVSFFSLKFSARGNFLT